MSIALFIISMILSAFFSSAEIAFSTAQKIKLKIQSHNGSFYSALVLKYVLHPEKFLIPILVGNSYVNVLYANSIMDINADSWGNFFSYAELVFYETILLLFACEIIPKIIAKQYNELYLKIFIYPFLIIDLLIKPVSFLILHIGNLIVFVFRLPKPKKVETAMTREIIEDIVFEALGEATEDEKDRAEILYKIINLQRIKSKEIMTHRSSISAVDINSSVYELKKFFKNTLYSKIIIFDGNIDNIVGIVYANDMLDKFVSISGIMRKPVFIPSNKDALSLFRMFKKDRLSIAVLIDEFGSCDGIVTMHDIIEEIVGKSEEGNERNRWRGVSYRKENNILIINGSVYLEDVEKAVSCFSENNNFSFNNVNYDTINGYIVNKLGRIPETGENFEIDELKIKIVNSRKNRIDTMIIDLNKK
ncbi:MAG: HlyC/CorC family transporter [Candidatus Delongbacteria bacterium]|nr:HlyC/CorC family transporter [Candidatus Delongbacteria bacterium]MBN2835263.1 HlyC/CorC family transporter [Candidatus Delongbacteria bacterium]